MKTWLKRSLIGLTALAAVGVAMTACAPHRFGHRHGPDGDPAFWREQGMARMASKLDLNAEQKAKLATLADTLEQQRKVLRGNATDPKAELQALVSGDKFDRTRAQTLVQEKTEAIRTGSPAVITAMGDFYDSLQPAQQQQVRDFLQRRGHGHHGGWRDRAEADGKSPAPADPASRP